jgi:hypothetical protein
MEEALVREQDALDPAPPQSIVQARVGGARFKDSSAACCQS